ncbi:pilus assembly PilX N-terminal domain-containing protein [Pseudoscardovia radai]|uniref:pilus assembly PilX N-terminal domain-containing protein n=1 Tax=Pseudoscardovia radai TaxID=987066 RepID=UPI0039944CB7
MRNTQLWTYIERQWGARIRKRAHGETGAAMIMALLFTTMVILTLAIITSVLVGQAVPYSSNRRTQQSRYAAESGLELGLSFMRSASAQAVDKKSYDPYMPASSSSASDFVAQSDGSVLLTCVYSSQSDNKTNSCTRINGTGTASSADDYSSGAVTVRVDVTYWDGDPTATDASGARTANQVTTLADMAKTRYALVTAKCFDSPTTTGDPILAEQGVYQFASLGKTTRISSSWSGNGSTDGSFTFYDNEQGASQHAWLHVTGSTLTADGDTATVTGTWIDNASEHLTNGEGNYIDDPADETCLVAADPSGNVDTTGTAVPAEGWTVRIFKRAWFAPGSVKGNGNTVTYNYNPMCQANDPVYSKYNAWSYASDDTIRLAGSDLCITGLDPDASAPAHVTLKTCGTSYSPSEFSSTWNHSKVDIASGNYGYDTAAELADAGSALNKLQKWSFYFGFINAAYSNPGQALATGAMTTDTRFEGLYPTKDNVWSNHGGCGSDLDPAVATDGCYVTAGKWGRVTSTGWLDKDNERTYLQSLGNGGEAGYTTSQIVSNTGACMQARAVSDFQWDTQNVVTKQCYVNAAPITSFCYKQMISGQSSDGTSNVVCGTKTDTSGTKYDMMTYDRPTNADGTIDTTKLAYKAKISSTLGCLKVDAASPGALLKATTRGCSTVSDPTYQFVRTEKLSADGASSGRFDYKFVLLSSLDSATQTVASDPDRLAEALKDDSKNAGALCLEETDTFTGWKFGTNGTDRNVSQYPQMFPYVTLQSCEAATPSSKDLFGRTTLRSTQQTWNAPASEQGKYKHYSETSSTSFALDTSVSASKGYSLVRATKG